MQGRVWIGTSGWNYKDWRGLFYPKQLPARRWFGYYAQCFETVEINNTFYRLPPLAVFEAWRRQAPRGFRYSVKVSRYLTHQKKLREPAEALANVLGGCRALGPHLGPILYQLPPFWHCNLERLAQFTGQLPSDLQHVFEFRHPSWYVEPVRALLADRGVSFCMHDMRGSVSPDWVTGPIAYIRFHGPTETRYVGRYSLEQLKPWARRIARLRKSVSNIYVYFNNDYHGNAIVNAQELHTLLGLKVSLAAAMPLLERE